MTKEQVARLEEMVSRIAMEDTSYPKTVGEIPTFPYSTFADLVAADRGGNCRISRFSLRMEASLFPIFGSQTTRVLFQILLFSVVLVPLVSLVLTFVISPWFLLGILFFFIGGKMAKGLYWRTLLDAATESELAFCFLFFASQIYVVQTNPYKEYEWRLITEGRQS